MSSTVAGPTDPQTTAPGTPDTTNASGRSQAEADGLLASVKDTQEGAGIPPGTLVSAHWAGDVLQIDTTLTPGSDDTRAMAICEDAVNFAAGPVEVRSPSGAVLAGADTSLTCMLRT